MDSQDSFFSSPTFLTTVAEVYFPHHKNAIELFELEGQFFRLLVIDGKHILSSFPFLDYHENVRAVHKKIIQKIPYLPRVVRSIKRYDSGNRIPENTDGVTTHLAPFIDLSEFGSWVSYSEFLDRRNHKFMANSKSRRGKLIREIGNPGFTFAHPDPSLFNLLIKWKTEQYGKIGGSDMFIDPRDKQFFITLWEKQALIISSISVNQSPIAIAVGARQNTSYYGWLFAYNPAYSQYAPGRLLLHYLIETCLKHKFKIFDFLLGSEEYKWHYATHYRVIGQLGQPSLGQQLQTTAARFQKTARSAVPMLYYPVKRTVITGKKLLATLKL